MTWFDDAKGRCRSFVTFFFFAHVIKRGFECDLVKQDEIVERWLVALVILSCTHILQIFRLLVLLPSLAIIAHLRGKVHLLASRPMWRRPVLFRLSVVTWPCSIQMRVTGSNITTRWPGMGSPSAKFCGDFSRSRAFVPVVGLAAAAAAVVVADAVGTGTRAVSLAGRQEDWARCRLSQSWHFCRVADGAWGGNAPLYLRRHHRPKHGRAQIDVRSSVDLRYALPLLARFGSRG